MRDATQYGTPERKAIDAYYNAVKREIVKQAPQYGEVMADYAAASDLLDDITKSFSLGQSAAAETGIRKLQAIMRNDVSSGYGKRGELADILETQGGATGIRERLAGQALSSYTPRGLSVAASPIAAIGIGAGGSLPGAAAYLTAASPRIVGEAMHVAGRAVSPAARAAQSTPVSAIFRALSRVPKSASPAAFQAGRVSDEDLPARPRSRQMIGP